MNNSNTNTNTQDLPINDAVGFGYIDNSDGPQDIPTEPDNHIPVPGDELGLYDNPYSTIERGSQRIAATIDGRAEVVSEPDRIVQNIELRNDAIPPVKQDDNKMDEKDQEIINKIRSSINPVPTTDKKINEEEKREYMERLEALLNASFEYEALLKTFGKNNLKDVLLEAKDKFPNFKTEDLLSPKSSQEDIPMSINIM